MGMPRTIGLPEPCNDVRKQLDPTTWRWKGGALWIRAKIGKEHLVRPWVWYVNHVPGYERIPIGQINPLFLTTFKRRFPKLAQPFITGLAFGKRIRRSKPVCKVCENVIFSPRFTGRRYKARHRDQSIVRTPRPKIIPLLCGCNRQNDIGMPRRRGPIHLVHDDCFRRLKGVMKTVQVLMVMEWVSTGPPDQTSIRERSVFTQILIGPTGVKQHFTDHCDRQEIFDWVL